ncbi:hypothetical protein NPIL_627861 [Nephila pilipes]|uniref:Uncharacterized protein n=1 Tax=Nephila pilipes TaxID=299642 RepID=A0A8X6R3V7_NEPPI|nr:hypothetical protein NPIL_627861 [Nephila pilipes]
MTSFELLHLLDHNHGGLREQIVRRNSSPRNRRSSMPDRRIQEESVRRTGAIRELTTQSIVCLSGQLQREICLAALVKVGFECPGKVSEKERLIA